VLGKSSEAADCEGENTLNRTIDFVDTTTYRTSSAGVPGVYQDDRKARLPLMENKIAPSE
jgi:hypothetical protein